MATPLGAPTRFVSIEKLALWFIPTIAATTYIPTGTEVTAGTDITEGVVAWTGWNLTTDFITVPNVKKRFQPKMANTESSDDSTITWSADTGGNDIRGVLQRGDVGFIAWMYAGHVATNLMTVFPIEVGSSSTLPALDAETRVVLAFSITDTPAQDVAIP
jgi:hypothetical protein